MGFVLERNWWSLIIRGIAGILLGIMTFAWPRVTLTVIVFLFAGYALVNGISAIAGAFHAASANERWGGLLLEGIVGILAALITMFWPAITAMALVYVVAAWAIIAGIGEIMASIRLRRHISGEWMMLLAGVASIVFGVLIATMPIVGALAIALWIGGFAFVFGGLMLALGIRLRHWHGMMAGPHIPAPAH
jgi:uncharacterized membrane protein HdeD (DUF308 family)